MTLMIRPMCTIIIITSYVYKHQLMELSTEPGDFTSTSKKDTRSPRGFARIEDA